MSRILSFCTTLLICLSISAQENIDKPEATEVWSPVPAIVKPGNNHTPPSDAIILLGSKTGLSMWESVNGGPAKWDIKDGEITVSRGLGAIRTKDSFGNCQLHIEWRTPEEVRGEGQGRGNSGVFLMEKYEVQVLDSYENRTYSNGQAASIYKQHIPLVNVCRPPGTWQSYDIIWTAPEFEEDGTLRSPAFITVLQNGVLVQNHVEIKGTTEYIGLPKYSYHALELPIQLQDHGNPVSYRNIWIRKL